MLYKSLSKSAYVLWALFGIAIFIGLWCVLTYSGIVNSLFLPSPTAVLSALKNLLINGELLSDIGASVFRIITGFILATIVAIPLGIALGVSKKFEAITEPIIDFIRYIPPSAFIPVAILWLGIAETSKLFIVFISITPFFILMIANIVLQTKTELVEAGLTLGATKGNVIKKIIVPYALPGIWDAMRLQIGAAWTFVILAEIVGSNSGLGHLMMQSQRFLRTDNIFAALIVVGILGLLTDYFFKAGYKVFFPWKEKTNNA